MIIRKLKERLGDVFYVKLIEMFSTESFSFKEIMVGIQNENLQTPVVMMNKKIIQAGGKLSERAIRMEIEKEKLINGIN